MSNYCTEPDSGVIKFALFKIFLPEGLENFGSRLLFRIDYEMTLLTGDLLDSSKVKANHVDEPALNTGHHDIPLSCNINRCDGSLTKGSRGFFFVCSQTSFNICFLYIEVKVIRHHFCRMC